MSENIPAGWKLVPIDATEAMEAAAVSRVRPYHDTDWSQHMPKDLFRLAWPALLNAAPQPPVPNVVAAQPVGTIEIKDLDAQGARGVSHVRPDGWWSKLPSGTYHVFPASAHSDLRKALTKIADMIDAEDGDLDDAITIARAALSSPMGGGE